MENIFNALIFLTALSLGWYVILVFRWTTGWHLIFKNKKVKLIGKEKFTIVVATRNEERNILNCLQSLNTQNYKNLEIIISDDFSEDSTRELISRFIHEKVESPNTWRLIEASSCDATGKKAALERAIKLATGNYILTTDADCTMNNNWVRSYADCFENEKSDMVTGFVRINRGKNIFENFQALEFLSLSGTGAASVTLGKPLMCNGANLGFSKEAFIRAGGYFYGSNQASGDDTFLMLRIEESARGSVKFNSSTDSIVTTIPEPDLKTLIAQRKRWSSKMHVYRQSYIVLTGLLLASVNILLIISLIISIAFNHVLFVVLWLWCIKAVVDFIFLLPVTKFAGQRQLLLLFLPVALLYPFYALAGITLYPGKVNYTWKGRAYTISSKK